MSSTKYQRRQHSDRILRRRTAKRRKYAQAPSIRIYGSMHSRSSKMAPRPPAILAVNAITPFQPNTHFSSGQPQTRYYNNNGYRGYQRGRGRGRGRYNTNNTNTRSKQSDKNTQGCWQCGEAHTFRNCKWNLFNEAMRTPEEEIRLREAIGKKKDLNINSSHPY